jgi:hypothetical protein
VRNKFATNNRTCECRPCGPQEPGSGLFHALTDAATKYRPCGPKNRRRLNQCAVICGALHQHGWRPHLLVLFLSTSSYETPQDRHYRCARHCR